MQLFVIWKIYVLQTSKTDQSVLHRAIFRVENLDRYDDRDVIILQSSGYDRLIAFGQKHLSDPFVQEGIQSISAREESCVRFSQQSAAHRDYSTVSCTLQNLSLRRIAFTRKTQTALMDMVLCSCLL